ncbi:MAG: hypothetical protein EAX95_07405 [Candidatus Thorarchaeota archaeon]|nr:hypothetical protein [Candidatus Thorarchaeota archaeon]
MDIPVVSRFIKGIQLFLEQKRLRWLTAIFLLGTAFIVFFREIGRWIPTTGIITLLGGIFPTFFLLTAFVSIIGLHRFIASDESYKRSGILFIPWIIVSVIVYAMLWIMAIGILVFLFIGVAFLGWIVLQAYLSSRSALQYSEVVDVKKRSKLTTVFFGSLNIVAYFIIWAALIALIIINPVVLAPENLILIGAAIVGAVLASGFNFLNGLIIVRERNKQTGDSVAILGIFVALYVAYFMYNVLKVDTGAWDPFSLLIDLGVSVFFLLYAMSSVGLTLASRADLDTRLKISKEFAATLTFFLASGYMFIEAELETLANLPGISNPALGALPDFIKLVLFPFVVLIMELLYLRRAGKVLEAPEIPEDLLIVEEETAEEEEEEPPGEQMLEPSEEDLDQEYDEEYPLEEEVEPEEADADLSDEDYPLEDEPE